MHALISVEERNTQLCFGSNIKKSIFLQIKTKLINI